MLIYGSPNIDLDDFDSEFLKDVFSFLRNPTIQQQIAANQWQEFLQAAHIREQMTDWSGFCSFLVELITKSGVDILRHISEIPMESFWESEDLKSVGIPANIKVINSRAFFDCPNLESIAVEQGLEIIGRETFKHCTSLYDVTLPSSYRRFQGKRLIIVRNSQKSIFEELHYNVSNLILNV